MTGIGQGGAVLYGRARHCEEALFRADEAIPFKGAEELLSQEAGKPRGDPIHTCTNPAPHCHDSIESKQSLPALFCVFGGDCFASLAMTGEWNACVTTFLDS